MTRRGISIEGVASEIGALGRMERPVSREELIRGLVWRFKVEEWEAREAIKKALEFGAVAEDENGMLDFVKTGNDGDYERGWEDCHHGIKESSASADYNAGWYDAKTAQAINAPNPFDPVSYSDKDKK